MMDRRWKVSLRRREIDNEREREREIGISLNEKGERKFIYFFLLEK